MDRRAIASKGAVGSPTSRASAEGICRLFGTTWLVAVLVLSMLVAGVLLAEFTGIWRQTGAAAAKSPLAEHADGNWTC